MVHIVSISGRTTGDNYTEGSNDEPVAGSEGSVCVVWEENKHENDNVDDDDSDLLFSSEEKTPFWADDIDRDASGRLVERWNGN